MKTESNLLLPQESGSFSSKGPKRRPALMAGALLLGLLAAAPVLAEPGRKHEPQYRSQPAVDHQPRHQSPRQAPRQAYPRAEYQPRHRIEPAPRMRPAPRFSPPAPVVYQAPARRSALPDYRFRGEDRTYLRDHYRDSLRSVRIDRRPHFAAGRVIPVAYRPHISRLPQHLGYRLPPPPRGYQVGYYEGYSVVYDPLTFTILGVLDLLTR